MLKQKDERRAHARLRITRAAVDEMLAILQQTFAENGFADDDIRTIRREVAAGTPYIVIAQGGRLNPAAARPPKSRRDNRGSRAPR